jgi:hypothetical protein
LSLAITLTSYSAQLAARGALMLSAIATGRGDSRSARPGIDAGRRRGGRPAAASKAAALVFHRASFFAPLTPVNLLQSKRIILPSDQSC